MVVGSFVSVDAVAVALVDDDLSVMMSSSAATSMTMGVVENEGMGIGFRAQLIVFSRCDVSPCRSSMDSSGK